MINKNERMEQDIRWEQRFSNFTKAFNKLTQAVEYIHLNLENYNHSMCSNVQNKIVKDGLIHRFEYTHELAWNVMKEYATYQGNSTIGGSRDAIREAFQLHLFSDGHVWMDMISSRNKTSHTYNEETANEIYTKILNDYYPAFLEFLQNMGAKRSGEQPKLF